MAFDWLRKIVLPLLLLVAVIALGYYLFKVREGFAAGDLTPLQIATTNRTLADATVNAVTVASTNINGFMAYLNSFATGTLNSTIATNIGNRLSTLITNMGSVEAALASFVGAYTAAGDTTSDASKAATLANTSITTVSSNFVTAKNAIQTLIDTYNNKAALASDITKNTTLVSTAITTLAASFQRLTTNVILANATAANAVATLSSAAQTAATTQSSLAQTAKDSTTQIRTKLITLENAITAAADTGLPVNKTALQDALTATDTQIGSAITDVTAYAVNVPANDTTAAPFITAVKGSTPSSATSPSLLVAFGTLRAAITTLITSITNTAGLTVYTNNKSAITPLLATFRSNALNPAIAAGEEALNAAVAAVTTASGVAQLAAANASAAAATSKNTMATIAVATISTALSDLKALTDLFKLDPTVPLNASKITTNGKSDGTGATYNTLKNDILIMISAVTDFNTNKGNNDTSAITTSSAAFNATTAVQSSLSTLALTIRDNIVNFSGAIGISTDAYTKALTNINTGLSDLSITLTNLQVNMNAAAAAAATAAGVAATTAASTAATPAASTAAGTTGTTDASGSSTSGGSSGLGALFSSDFLNKFSDSIMTNSNANVSIDFEYQGDKGKWFDYLSQEHKDAVAAQKAAAAAAAKAAETQNSLLNNMGKATASKVYYDDSKECEDEPSPCTQQGKELTSAKKGMKCPTVDTNQYVRKDSVPCWGCDLE